MLVKFNYAHSNTNSLATLVVAIYTTLVFSHKRQGKDSQNSKPGLLIYLQLIAQA